MKNQIMINTGNYFMRNSRKSELIFHTVKGPIYTHQLLLKASLITYDSQLRYTYYIFTLKTKIITLSIKNKN